MPGFRRHRRPPPAYPQSHVSSTGPASARTARGSLQSAVARTTVGGGPPQVFVDISVGGSTIGLPPAGLSFGRSGHAAPRKLTARWAFAFLETAAAMFILYADEFGHDGIWDPADPQHRHHPLFGLAGAAVPGDRCRDFDRGYLRLKESYYKFEIARATVVKGIQGS